MTMPAFAFDLDAYLIRIGYTGPRTPTAAVLAEIQRLHVFTIPFENIDVLLGRPIRIDLPSVERKLVHDRRGGYCFEQNTLLQAALTSLGFRVTPLVARVRWQVPSDVRTALTHMTLLVEADGRRWLADAGFGSGSLSAPLHFDTETEQLTPHEPRRLIMRDGLHVHQTMHPTGEWSDLYEFASRPVPAVDFAMGNWWTSTYPTSRFVQNLTLSLSAAGLRRTIFNREFSTRWTDGRTEHRVIESPKDLLDLLDRSFGLRLPADTRITVPAAPWPDEC